MPKDVNSPGYTLFFALVICLICSVALAGLNLATKDIQAFNVKVDQQRSVLKAAMLPEASGSANDVQALFASGKIKTILFNKADGEPVSEPSIEAYNKKPELFDKVAEIFVYEDEAAGNKIFVMPVEGKGLWGPLKGYFALDKAADKVIGISFYFHKETPGLGAEIENQDWLDQFLQQKQILEDGEFRGLRVLKGDSWKNKPINDQPYLIDGISGATLTCKGVNQIFQSDDQPGITPIRMYLPFLEKNRVKESQP